MSFATTETTHYYNDLVKTQRRDQFLALMFLPAPSREAAVALYALDIELEHVGHAVKEEMIGHIRYAWWRENVDKMAISDHPVLKALASVPFNPEALQPLVAAYAEAFPNRPDDTISILKNILTTTIKTNHRWQKARDTIHSHRTRHGKKCGNWLLIKLLFV